MCMVGDLLLLFISLENHIHSGNDFSLYFWLTTVQRNPYKGVLVKLKVSTKDFRVQMNAVYHFDILKIFINVCLVTILMEKMMKMVGYQIITRLRIIA